MEAKLYESKAPREALTRAIGTVGQDLFTISETMSWEDTVYAAALAMRGFSSAVRALHPDLDEETMRRHIVGIIGTAMHQQVTLQYQGKPVSDYGKGPMQ